MQVNAKLSRDKLRIASAARKKIDDLHRLPQIMSPFWKTALLMQDKFLMHAV